MVKKVASGLQVMQGGLDGLLIVEPPVFEDSRGFFMETHHAEKYRAAGIPADLVQDNLSFSRRGVLRGLHYQEHHPQGKLVFVIEGTIFDVAVDIRPDSPTFGRWEGQVLSSRNRLQFYLPPGFAHGFVVLSDAALVMYKCTDFYCPEDDRGIRWDDPRLAIEWPEIKPVLSPKDAALPLFEKVFPDLNALKKKWSPSGSPGRRDGA